MNSIENRDTRGTHRLGLRASASVLALSVLAHPSLLAAQQTQPTTATASSVSLLPTAGQTTAGTTAAANGASALTDVAASPSAAADPLATGSVVPATQTLEPLADADAIPVDESLGRQNVRETRLDNPTADRINRELDSEDDSGIRLGTLILRPSISQKLGSETEKSGGVIAPDERLPWGHDHLRLVAP